MYAAFNNAPILASHSIPLLSGQTESTDPPTLLWLSFKVVTAQSPLSLVKCLNEGF